MISYLDEEILVSLTYLFSAVNFFINLMHVWAVVDNNADSGNLKSQILMHTLRSIDSSTITTDMNMIWVYGHFLELRVPNIHC